MTNENTANNKRIAKNTMFLYFRMLLVLVVSLYTSRVVLHALGVQDYGVYNVVGGFVSMFAFLNTSMSNGIQRFYNFEMGKGRGIREIYSAAITVQMIIAFFILILAETFGLWYINNIMVIPIDRIAAANWVFQLSVLSLIIVIMQVPYNAAIMAHERMNYFAYVGIAEVLLRLLNALLLQYVEVGDKLILYGFLSFAVSIIYFLLCYIYSHKKFNELRLSKTFERQKVKSITSFSFWNIFETFAYMMKGQGLNMLLNVFFGTVVNAARGISFQILNALQGFVTNILLAFRPQLVKSYAMGDYKRTENMMYSMSKITFYMMSLLGIPVIIEIDYILHLWLGDMVPAYTNIFTSLVIINTLIYNFNIPLSQVVHATGKMRNYQLVASLIIISILPISYITLKLGGGPPSVYIVSMSIAIINQISSMYLLKKIFDYDIFNYVKNVIFKCLIVAILSLPIPILLHNAMANSILRLIVITLTSSICILYFGYLFGLNKSEKFLCKNMISSRLKHFNLFSRSIK